MKKFLYLFIAFLVVLCDQATKLLVRGFVSPLESIQILPFLHLVSVRNEGAAFGMFKSLGNTVFIVISLAAIVAVLVLLLKGREDELSLSLILAGAVGNVIDRIVYGSVTDFLDIAVGRFHWPAFNVADSALTIGIGLMVIRSFFHPQRRAV